MDKSTKLLSDIVTFRTYSKFLPSFQRREVLEECINRNMQMHLERFGSLSKSLSKDIIKSFGYIHDLHLMPSMRSMQFSGDAITKNNVRMYNCSAAPIDDIRIFGEAFFLLLSGCGFGFSVQKEHIKHIPTVSQPTEEGIYYVHDSITGWAQALDMLIDAYFLGRMRPVFNFSNIRPKGSLLKTTGGRAPGSSALKTMLESVESRLKLAIGRKMTSVELYDLVCIISDCVLAGGIRRAALICLFDRDDSLMLNAKTGNWWEKHPHRARSNNSVMLPRDISFDEFMSVFEITKNSGSGEPGFSWSNNFNMLTNPCFTGDMELKTENGFKTFAELNGQNANLFNYKNEIVKGKIWSNGVKPVVKIKLRSNEVIRCTEDHRFMLTDGTEEIAKNLVGKRIMPNYKMRTTNDEFVKLGFIQGDATLGRISNSTHKGMEIHIGKDDKDIATLFGVDHTKNTSHYIRGYNDICLDLQFSPNPLPTRSFPGTYDLWDKSKKASFLRGMYSANGSVIKKGRVSFKTTSRLLVDKLKDSLFNDFNIDSYITINKSKDVEFESGTYTCKESYDLNIGRFIEVVKFAEVIGFVHSYKTDDLEAIILDKSPMVRWVEDDGEEEVFDFTLYDDTHWGIVRNGGEGNGYIAHNCHEISLNPNQFCNLVTGNLSGVKNEKDFLKRCHGMALIATLQASYTDFPYLRDKWRQQTEDEALIGCSLTGIADVPSLPTSWLDNGAKLITELNEKYAKKIGINPAARCTAIKPEGSSSCVLGTASGIHNRHAEYYIRRVEMLKDDSLYKYLQTVMPELCEDSFSSPVNGIVSVPQMSPQGASINSDSSSAIDLLKRAMTYNKHWVSNGHRSGDNKNNVSITVYVKEHEWDTVANFMYKNRNLYTGISLLPFNGGTYKQAPFETIDRDKFDELSGLIGNVDLRQVRENADYTARTETVACSGGVCEIL